MATLYLNEQQAIVRKHGDTLIVEHANKRKEEVSLHNISQVVVAGDVLITVPILDMLLERGIEICFLTSYGLFLGRLTPTMNRNAPLRLEQYHAHTDLTRVMQVAQAFVRGKLENMQALLLHYDDGQDEGIQNAVTMLKMTVDQLSQAHTPEELLDTEGDATTAYFRAFGRLLRTSLVGQQRIKRPPHDPIHAMLSLGYTLLSYQITSAIQVVGLDPYIGFFHQPRHGRPVLALDLMEELRPIIADTMVLDVTHQHVFTDGDFEYVSGTVYIRPEAHKKFYSCFEERLEEEIYHPQFGYRTTYRRCIELQVRLLGKWLMGEIPDYPPLCGV